MPQTVIPSTGRRPAPVPVHGTGGNSLRVGLIGTFPPRACGLATFTGDMADSLRSLGATVIVAAMVDTLDDDAPNVEHVIVQTDERAARAVAVRLSAEVDVVLIQHEFGIFGGRHSDVLGAFTGALTVPYAITMHTVAASFVPWQVQSLTQPLADAAVVIAFSEQAVDLLAAQFPDLRSRCRVVPHPAPSAMFRRRTPDLRHRCGISGNAKVITTFGLLSPSKGIEHVIRSMPRLRDEVEHVTYIVAGRTHPQVVLREGERYREALVALTHALRVQDIVSFRDWFHDVDELSALLRSTDVFVTPYADAEQIVSGALSFAIAAGVPFVSTPYRYAAGLAADGCGVTTAFGDDDALAEAVSAVLNDDEWRGRMAGRARAVSASRSWPQVAQTMDHLLRELLVGTSVRS